MKDFYNLVEGKIYDDHTAFSAVLNQWRFLGYTLVFSNGCFDILHRGHVEYLAKAASLGDKLILGLNTDASISRIKGPQRPVQDEKSRATVMASLHFIDAVVFFDEDTPYELIKFVQPDVLVKGKDYKPDDIVGADIVKNRGGSIETIALTEGYSTTSVIEKIKKI